MGAATQFMIDLLDSELVADIALCEGGLGESLRRRARRHPARRRSAPRGALATRRAQPLRSRRRRPDLPEVARPANRRAHHRHEHERRLTHASWSAHARTAAARRRYLARLFGIRPGRRPAARRDPRRARSPGPVRDRRAHRALLRAATDGEHRRRAAGVPRARVESPRPRSGTARARRAPALDRRRRHATCWSATAATSSRRSS